MMLATNDAAGPLERCKSDNLWDSVAQTGFPQVESTQESLIDVQVIK